MKNQLVVFILIISVLACSDNPKYNTLTLDGVKLKIDNRIIDKHQSRIFKSLSYHLSEEGWIKDPEIKEIIFDSVLYSYLFTIKTNRAISENKLHLMKAYVNLLSKEVLDNSPIHINYNDQNKYIKYDSTILSNEKNTYQIGKISLVTNDIDEYINSRIAIIIDKSIRNIELNDTIYAELSYKNAAYNVDLFFQSKNQTINQIRDSILKIDPYYKLLILDKEMLQINFKNRNGNDLLNPILFE